MPICLWTTILSSFLPEFLDEGSSHIWPEETETELCPALPCVNKQIHKEAAPVLYGDNRFQFAELDDTSTRCRTPLAVFVQQIGPVNARLPRHISIDFPTAPLARGDDMSILPSIPLENIDILRESCADLATVKMSLPLERADFVLGNTALFTQFLDVIQMRLGSFSFLQGVTANVSILGWDPDEADDEDSR